MVYAILLAGGRGERFWPLSRSHRAKQFLPLLGDRTLLSETARRLGPLLPRDRLIVVSGRDQVPLVRESLPDLPESRILGEPFGRNTAPAVAFGAAWAAREDPDATLLVIPSDAWVADDHEYVQALEAAIAAAEKRSALVTLGVAPTRPETGYGYLETGDPLPEDPRVVQVSRFVEKPDAARALEYLATGRHLWNCGIFVMKAAVFRDALRMHLPEVDAPLSTLEKSSFDYAAIDAYYAAVPSISIDYGVMEKAGNVLAVRARFPWDDLGSWVALERVLTPRGDHIAMGDTAVLDSPGAIVWSGEGLVAAIGADNLIIVRTRDATLVLPRERAQEVRRIVQLLSQRDDLEKYR